MVSDWLLFIRQHVGLESCRKACGGHGYTLSSGIGELASTYIGVQTAEGENYLLTQQVGRYLLKALKAAQSGERLALPFPLKERRGNIY